MTSCTENYDSVVFMRDLNEALERIDSSFQFALAGREEQSYEAIPGELEKVPGVPRPRTAQHHRSRRKGIGRPLERSLQGVPRRSATLFIKSRRAIADALYFGKDKDQGKDKEERRGCTRYFRRSRPFPAISSG